MTNKREYTCPYCGGKSRQPTICEDVYKRQTYTIYEDHEGRFYHTDGKTCWVKTGITVSGIEHIEYLPVMDYKNKSISVETVTSVDVNKAVQRSLTKAAARHGLGLYIYAGEDLPEETDAEIYCADCNALITSTKKKNGERWPQRELIAYSNDRFKPVSYTHLPLECKRETGPAWRLSSPVCWLHRLQA